MAHTDQLTYITAAPGKGDVMVRATYFKESGNVIVTCQTLPGGARWAEPLPEMMRGLVDKIAARHGVKRDGKRKHLSGWSYAYKVG